MLKKLDATPLHERVYRELRRALMAGLYPVGQTFSLSKIADELGTSVMPVREAINRLAAERAVKSLPKRGVIIPDLTPGKYHELVKVRIMLEGMATEMAARSISGDALAKLQSITDRMNEIRDDSSKWQSFNLLNYEFHFLIYRSGNPQVILPIIETLWLQSGPLLNIYKTIGMLPNQSRHEEITQALAAGDRARARDAVAKDILAGYLYVSKGYDWPVDLEDLR